MITVQFVVYFSPEESWSGSLLLHCADQNVAINSIQMVLLDVDHHQDVFQMLKVDIIILWSRGQLRVHQCTCQVGLMFTKHQSSNPEKLEIRLL